MEPSIEGKKKKGHSPAAGLVVAIATYLIELKRVTGGGGPGQEGTLTGEDR